MSGDVAACVPVSERLFHSMILTNFFVFSGLNPVQWSTVVKLVSEVYLLNTDGLSGQVWLQDLAHLRIIQCLVMQAFLCFCLKRFLTRFLGSSQLQVSVAAVTSSCTVLSAMRDFSLSLFLSNFLCELGILSKVGEHFTSKNSGAVCRS